MIHTDIRIATRDIQGVLDDLNHFMDDDEQLKLDMLEGQTGLFDIARYLLNQNEDDEGLIASLDVQIDNRKSRKDRAVNRIDRRKAALARLMDCAGIKKLPLAEATVSLRTILPKAKVADPGALPDEFVTIQIVRKPDLDLINAAENPASIPGVVMTNGSASLTVRRK